MTSVHYLWMNDSEVFWVSIKCNRDLVVWDPIREVSSTHRSYRGIAHTQEHRHIQWINCATQFAHLVCWGATTVATVDHLPECAQALVLAGGGRRKRENEGSAVRHCPQTGSVHLAFDGITRLRRGSFWARGLFVLAGHSSGRRAAEEIRFARNEQKIRDARSPKFEVVMNHK